MSEQKQLKVTLVKSTIASKPAHRATVQALGLGKLNSFAILPDNEAVRGMIFKIKHLITVDEI